MFPGRYNIFRQRIAKVVSQGFEQKAGLRENKRWGKVMDGVWVRALAHCLIKSLSFLSVAISAQAGSVRFPIRM